MNIANRSPIITVALLKKVDDHEKNPFRTVPSFGCYQCFSPG
jgi:hypothetical protein